MGWAGDCSVLSARVCEVGWPVGCRGWADQRAVAYDASWARSISGVELCPKTCRNPRRTHTSVLPTPSARAHCPLPGPPAAPARLAEYRRRHLLLHAPPARSTSRCKRRRRGRRTSVRPPPWPPPRAALAWSCLTATLSYGRASWRGWRSGCPTHSPTRCGLRELRAPGKGAGAAQGAHWGEAGTILHPSPLRPTTDQAAVLAALHAHDVVLALTSTAPAQPGAAHGLFEALGLAHMLRSVHLRPAAGSGAAREAALVDALRAVRAETGIALSEALFFDGGWSTFGWRGVKFIWRGGVRGGRDSREKSVSPGTKLNTLFRRRGRGERGRPSGPDLPLGVGRSVPRRPGGRPGGVCRQPGGRPRVLRGRGF